MIRKPLRHQRAVIIRVYAFMMVQVFAMEHDDIAVETAVAMVYNGIAHTVQMCSATDLEDLAVGFSVTEGIIDSAKDIKDIKIEVVCNGIEVHMTLANRHFERLKRARRSMGGRTGCGICGTESLQHVVAPGDSRFNEHFIILCGGAACFIFF